MKDILKLALEVLKAPSFLTIVLIVYVTPVVILGFTLKYTMENLSHQLDKLVDISQQMLHNCTRSTAYNPTRKGVTE